MGERHLLFLLTLMPAFSLSLLEAVNNAPRLMESWARIPRS